MGLQEQKIESLPFVTGELNYLAPTRDKPRTYAFDPPAGEPKSTALPEAHAVPIFDARPIAKNLSLDREGFTLVRHPTSVKNFYDEQEIRNAYYPAVEAFLRATLKADRVFIFDHTVRKRVEGAPDLRVAARGSRPPASTSTRPIFPAAIASMSICLRKRTNSSRGACRSSTSGGRYAARFSIRRWRWLMA